MRARRVLGPISRLRVSSAAVLSGALLVAVSQASAFTCMAVPEIRLTTEQVQLLRTFKAKEDSANAARLAVVLGTALDCITSSNATDCPVSVTTSEWDKMASAPGNIDKFTAEAIAEDVELYLFSHKDLSPDVRSFFVCLDKYYTERSK